MRMALAIAFEGGHGVGTHDLRGDEEMDAVHQTSGQQCGVQPRACLDEQGQDSLFASLSSNLAQRDAACFGGQHFDADATIS